MSFTTIVGLQFKLIQPGYFARQESACRQGSLYVYGHKVPLIANVYKHHSKFICISLQQKNCICVYVPKIILNGLLENEL